MSKLLSFVGTGHRPPRLGLSYGESDTSLLTGFARLNLEKMLEVHNPFRIISGCAQGWDLALADAAIELGIPLYAALPFKTMGANWPADAQERLKKVLDYASEVHVCCEKSSNKAYIIRDQHMVDLAVRDGGMVLALFDGDPSGGTFHTIEYARKLGVPIVNFYGDFVKESKLVVAP